jgi:predicted TIM-barrel fold metal-dependent hydrolase
MDQSSTRRQFLHQTAAAALGLAAQAATARERPEPMNLPSPAQPPGQEGKLPIIDTHQHLWDLGKFRLPWVKKDSPLARNYLMADYLEAAAGLNVVKTVYMEVDVDPAQQPQEAAYVTDLCQHADNPMVAAVISGRPASEGFAKYITAFKDSAVIKGVRQVLHGEGTPAGYCLDRQFVKGVQLLGDLGMSFDLCVRPGEIADAARLVDQCPGTSFILDHCGNGDVQAKDRTQWQRDMAEIAKRQNVVCCKVSGIVAGAAEKWTPDDLAPVISHTLEVFGPQRVMFAGDWPVCTLRATLKQWVEALKTIVSQRKAEEQRQLFHDNAVRVYRLG